MLTDCQLDPWEHTSVKFESKYKIFVRENAFEIAVYEWRSHIQWRHNERDGVSNHRPLDCLLNRLFRRRSKKLQSSTSLTFVWGIHRWPVNSAHNGQVTRKMFPFDDVIMVLLKRRWVRQYVRGSCFHVQSILDVKCLIVMVHTQFKDITIVAIIPYLNTT